MSPIASEADLRSLRGIQEDNMPHRCRLEALTEVERPSGGIETVWTVYASNLKCRLSPITGTDLPLGTALTPETNYRLALPYGQPVSAKDRAVVTGKTKGVVWEQTVGFTFIDTPKAFQTETLCYATDKVVQVGEQ